MITLLRQYKANKNSPWCSSTPDLSYFLPSGISNCTVSTGRAALKFLFQRASWTYNHTILIPAYLPEGIIRPIIASGIKIRFYKLDNHLFPNLEDLNFQVRTDNSICACIVIHPLGFEAPIDAIKDILMPYHIICIEDCAQGLFSHYQSGGQFGKKGDCALVSLNKFLPVPDGAVLLSHLESINLEAPEMNQILENTQAIKYYMDHLAINSDIYDSLDFTSACEMMEASAHAYDRYYDAINTDLSFRQMSDISVKILNNIDYNLFIANRRRNCCFLYSSIDNHLIKFLFNDYSDNIIPMAVPVIVPKEKRKKWLDELQKQGIFLATLIERWNYVPENQKAHFSVEVQYMESHVLIPINEFLSEQQMEYLVMALNQLC